MTDAQKNCGRHASCFAELWLDCSKKWGDQTKTIHIRNHTNWDWIDIIGVLWQKIWASRISWNEFKIFCYHFPYWKINSPLYTYKYFKLIVLVRNSLSSQKKTLNEQWRELLKLWAFKLFACSVLSKFRKIILNRTDCISENNFDKHIEETISQTFDGKYFLQSGDIFIEKRLRCMQWIQIDRREQ